MLFEHQDIRSVGKDGRPAFCHLFLDHDAYLSRRSYAYIDGVEEWSLRRLFSRLFFAQSTAGGNVQTYTLEGKQMLMLPLEELELDLNVTRHTLQLILFLLAIHPTHLINVISCM